MQDLHGILKEDAHVNIEQYVNPPGYDISCQHTGIIERRTFINGTHKPISVVLRNNVTFTVTPTLDIQNNLRRSGFIIRKQYTIPKDNIIPIWNSLNQLNDKRSYSEIGYLKSVMRDVMADQRFIGARLDISYDIIISKYALEEHQRLFIPCEDIVISHLPLDDVGYHPFSYEHVIEDKIRGFRNDRKGLVYCIDIIDNDHNLSKRFTSLNGTTVDINPYRDVHCKNGVYVSYQIDQGQIHTAIFELDEMETLGLYRSKEQAKEHGDVKNKNLADIEKLKLDLQREKAVYEQSILEQRKRYEEEKYKMEQDKLQSEMHKNRVDDRYQEKSQQRKDITDTIKFALSIATAISSIALLISKSKDGKKGV